MYQAPFPYCPLTLPGNDAEQKPHICSFSTVVTFYLHTSQQLAMTLMWLAYRMSRKASNTLRLTPCLYSIILHLIPSRYSWFRRVRPLQGVLKPSSVPPWWIIAQATSGLVFVEFWGCFCCFYFHLCLSWDEHILIWFHAIPKYVIYMYPEYMKILPSREVFLLVPYYNRPNILPCTDGPLWGVWDTENSQWS